jgi:acetyl esterase/lipase
LRLHETDQSSLPVLDRFGYYRPTLSQRTYGNWKKIAAAIGKNTAMKKTLWFFLCCLAAMAAQISTAPLAGGTQAVGGSVREARLEVIRLWEKGAPGALGDADADRPTLTVYRPTSPGARRADSGLAVIIAPGGAYMMLASSYEGVEEAYWLNSLGATAFVLKYRLAPRYKLPIQLEDAQRAIRLVRSCAASMNIRPDRIGMMGFSAGGHLSAMAGVHFDEGKPDAPDPIDRVSSRPDFLVLSYALTAMKSFASNAKPDPVLGDNPDPKLLDFLSPELHVTPQTPPTFLFATTNDQMVPVANSVQFYSALVKAKVPAEMHLFENGAHGAGMGLHDPALSMWPTLLANWFRSRGLLTSTAGTAAGK